MRAKIKAELLFFLFSITRDNTKVLFMLTSLKIHLLIQVIKHKIKFLGLCSDK